MFSSTPAEPLDRLRESLDWARDILARQPERLRRDYQQAGDTLARALTQKTYALTAQLPFEINTGASIQAVSPARTMLHVGSRVNRLRRKPCNSAIVQRLRALCQQADSPVALIGRLTGYVAAQQILTQYVPTPAQLDEHYRAFDAEGGPSVEDERTAEAVVARLSERLEWLNVVEALYPAWTGDALYDERYSALAMHLVRQGRALANYSTRLLIEEVHTRWRDGDIIRGLTLLVPYLDERRYRMDTYRVVVIPGGRIPFRPEFVVGACRVAQREVRKNPHFSQATRWQLTSQLDSVIQAFEVPV